LSGARLHSQSDLLVAEKDAVVLIGSSGHGADRLVVKRAVAQRTRSSTRSRINPILGRGSAGSLIGQDNLASFHSAFVSVGDTVATTDFLEFLFAGGFKLAVGVHDLSARTIVKEVDSGVVQGAQVRIGGVIVTADRLISPSTETGLRRSGGRRSGRGHLRNHDAAHRSDQKKPQQLILGTFLH